MNQVVICGNNKIKDDLLILILSIVKNVSIPLEIHFLTANLENLNKEYIPLKKENADFYNKLLKTKNKDSSFTVHDITNLVEKEIYFSSNRKTGYTPYIFLRLFIDRLDFLNDKVLYLDTDIIVNSDLNSLFSIDISNYEFAACLDYYGKDWISKKYINSGVILFNLEKCKKTNLFKKCLSFMKNRKLIMPDQSALNKCVESKLIIDSKYNYQSPKVPTSKVVIHHFSKKIFFFPIFSTKNIKPHDVDNVHKVLKLFCYDDILEDYKKYKDKLY